ncbi:MAG: ComF family protein [Candidatus Edwardsbacteria bacterium]|nr:ComF family protein [Candidatus Edwardsbacteria bacterium]MBU1577008.1 ComF family protein [Candidatus Edwardsbacteria bacterium]MBU2464502.1 ComF family protein [Candidatus Edwardsbacteria bacterium]MBU2594815.1 ComF family protein [Candidatus Edwardsbacteria bacterium]
MYRHISSFLGSLANFVFPPFCSHCHLRAPEGLAGGICQDCWSTVKIWKNGQCQRCGQPAAEAESLCQHCLIPDWGCNDIKTLGPFEAPLSDAVHMLKYSDAKSVSRRLGAMMAKCVVSDQRYNKADLVLAVPLHKARKRERGYNQAQLLAEQLGKSLGIPSPEGLVTRARHTRSQTTLNKEQRLRNVEGIFAVHNPDRIKDRSIILVDDVLTTGATIGSCGQSLLLAGAREVLAMTAAAAPL